MQKQFGRSMIEMLGVLAIIAVVSIGGLLGYRRAVNNHQANQILDDANRLAFAVMENDRAYEANTFLDIEYTRTGIYDLSAFMGKVSGQFGIVAMDVPKGVCESLLGKAAVDYNVRTLPAQTFDLVEDILAYGVLYDAQHIDICNDMNDIVLYFGNISRQCNAQDKNGNIPCTSNADCCNGYFCHLLLPSTCPPSEPGRCETVISWRKVPVATLPNGHTLVIGHYVMSWGSAQNWCAGWGLRPASRSDIGCDGLLDESCASSSIVQEIRKTTEWGPIWLESSEDEDSECEAYVLGQQVRDNDNIIKRHKYHFNGGTASCQ